MSWPVDKLLLLLCWLDKPLLYEVEVIYVVAIG